MFEWLKLRRIEAKLKYLFLDKAEKFPPKTQRIKLCRLIPYSTQKSNLNLEISNILHIFVLIEMRRK